MILAPKKKQMVVPSLQRGFFTLPGGMGAVKGASLPAGATWNSSDKNAGITLTNSDKTAAISGGSDVTGIVRATITKSSGKYYWEVVDTASSLDAIARTLGVGFANTTASLSQDLGGNVNGWAIWGPGGASAEAMRYTNATVTTNIAYRFVTGDVLMFALDIGAGKFWFGKNGTWASSGNPEAGTNAIFTGIPAGTYTPACSPFKASNVCRLTLRQPSESTHYALTTFQNGFY